MLRKLLVLSCHHNDCFQIYGYSLGIFVDVCFYLEKNVVCTTDQSDRGYQIFHTKDVFHFHDCNVSGFFFVFSVVLSGWWFVAHLTDILHHCGQLESQRLECVPITTSFSEFIAF